MTADQSVSVRSDRVSIRLFGNAHLMVAEQDVIKLERHDAALLCMLAVDGPQAREKVARWLWPGLPDGKARSALRQRLYRLRRVSGRNLLHGDDPIRLAGGIEVDILWLRHEDEGDAVPHADVLLEGLDFTDLQDVDHWLSQARETTTRQLHAMLGRLADDLERRGCLAEALPYAQRLVRLDDLVEPSHRRLASPMRSFPASSSWSKNRSW